MTQLKINQKKNKLISIDIKIQMMSLEILREMKMQIFNILKNSKILIIKILDKIILGRTMLKRIIFLEIMWSDLNPQTLKEETEWLSMISKMNRTASKLLIKLQIFHMIDK